MIISIKNYKNEVKTYEYNYDRNDIALLCQCAFTVYGEPNIVDKKSSLMELMDAFMSDWHELSENDTWILSCLTEGSLLNGKDFISKYRKFMIEVMKTFPERVPKKIA